MMSANPLTAVPQPQPQTPAATTTTSRARRASKIQRTQASFRPGQRGPRGLTGKPRTLTFSVPSTAAVGTDEELTTVRALVLQLQQHQAALRVDGYGISKGAWEIRLTLIQQPEANDDQLLSAVFQGIDATIADSDALQKGFVVSALPSWKFEIGDFVADKGGFI